MGGQCEKHGEMMQVVGEQVEANRIQTKQIGEIFTLLSSIKTSIDQNAVRAEARDQKLCEIDRKIENGLRSEVAKMSRAMEQLTICMDRRKKERDRGVEGFFRKGFRKIYENGGMITILAIGYAVLWVLARLKVFGDEPVGLLKLLGAG